MVLYESSRFLRAAALVLLLEATAGAAPYLVKDINPTPGVGSDPSDFIVVNGTLFFLACDQSYYNKENDYIRPSHCGLWESDGTPEGTMRVPGVPWIVTRAPAPLTEVNGTLVFEACEPAGSCGLWKTDGTASGTMRVTDIPPDAADPYFTNVNGTLFFKACDPTSGCELWKSDGTAEGTARVADITPGPASTDFSGAQGGYRNRASLGDTLFFVADEPTGGSELWKSDGTAEGTRRVADINPGPEGSFLRELTNVGGTLFFTASRNGPLGAMELWKSDGTEAGTVRVAAPPLGPEFISGITAVDGTAFFVGQNLLRTDVARLWKSDGTAEGTVAITDLVSVPFADVNGLLVMYSYYGAVLRSDGTAAGTYSIAQSGGLRRITVANGSLFYMTEGLIGSSALWKSDATSAVRVADLSGLDFSSHSDSPEFELAYAGDKLFFSAYSSDAGTELWAIRPCNDGTLDRKGSATSTTSTTSTSLPASQGAQEPEEGSQEHGARERTADPCVLCRRPQKSHRAGARRTSAVARESRGRTT